MAPSQLAVHELSGWSGPLELVGPSFWGMVYRSQDDGTLHRLVPAERATLERRRALREWTGQPGLAPIVAAAQLPSGVGYLVRYGVRAERTMTDLLEEPDPRIRLEGVTRLLEAFPGWANVLGDGWLPMPADVVFAAGNVPWLLPMPHRWRPAVVELFEEPDRAWHLAPELARGRPAATRGAVDRYALGTLVFRCFFRLGPADPGEILLKVATGTASEFQYAASSLHLWIERLPATPKLRATALDLLVADPARRCRVDLRRLADRLAHLLPWTDPLQAVVRLRRSGRLADAYLLLHDALLTSEGHELLLLGARLAEELGRPLEAVDLLERAIAANPHGRRSRRSFRSWSRRACWGWPPGRPEQEAPGTSTTCSGGTSTRWPPATSNATRSPSPSTCSAGAGLPMLATSSTHACPTGGHGCGGSST